MRVGGGGRRGAWGVKGGRGGFWWGRGCGGGAVRGGQLGVEWGALIGQLHWRVLWVR